MYYEKNTENFDWTCMHIGSSYCTGIWLLIIYQMICVRYRFYSNIEIVDINPSHPEFRLHSSSVTLPESGKTVKKIMLP